MGTFYLPTKFQLHSLVNNGDLFADKNCWKYTHTHRLNLILSPYRILRRITKIAVAFLHECNLSKEQQKGKTVKSIMEFPG